MEGLDTMHYSSEAQRDRHRPTRLRAAVKNGRVLSLVAALILVQITIPGYAVGQSVPKITFNGLSIATPSTPSASTGSATNITSTSARLTGSVNPNEASTNAWFEWGTSATLPTFTSTPMQPIGAGVFNVSTAADVTGLSPGTQYFYRAVGQNSVGITRGLIQNFKTLIAFGDVDGDASVSAFDASLILQHVVGLITLDSGAQLAADVDGDANITAFDASLVLQFVVGLRTCFPAEPGCTTVTR